MSVKRKSFTVDQDARVAVMKGCMTEAQARAWPLDPEEACKGYASFVKQYLSMGEHSKPETRAALKIAFPSLTLPDSKKLLNGFNDVKNFLKKKWKNLKSGEKTDPILLSLMKALFAKEGLENLAEVAKALQKRLKELRFSRKFSTCEVEWEVSQIKGRLHELLGPSSLEEDEEDELETAKQVNKRLLQTIEEAKEWAEQCKPPVKEEPAEAAQAAAVEPGQAAAVEPAEAPAVGEPGKADAVGEPGKADEIPTGDTEESEEEDWQKVGEKKRKRKKPQKKTKIILSLQRLSTFLFSLQRLHL